MGKNLESEGKDDASRANDELFMDLNPDILQKRFLNALLKIQNARRGSLWIRRGTTCVCVEAAGIDSENIVGMTLDASTPSIVGWVIENGRMTSAQVGSDRRHNREIEANFAIKSRQILCFPLPLGGHIFGAVQIIDTRADSIHLHLDVSRLSHFQDLVEICAITLGNTLCCAGEKKRIRRRVSIRSGIKTENTIIGQSKAFHKSMDLVRNYANTDFNVLITGESGTGKELVAERLHTGSDRADYPFLVQNCSAIPATLLESELFGYKKGAFTGATRDRAGLFETADGGTVFLDEIGDMPMGTQAGILRVMQKNEIKPLGSSQVRHINVRIIAATNKDLSWMIRENRFRQDLYYRLSVLPVHLPPLRERKEDIALLIQHFLNIENRKANALEKKITPEAVSCLSAYTWPGNIRELENLIRYLMVTAPHEIITPDDLPEHILEPCIPDMPGESIGHAPDQAAGCSVSAGAVPLRKGARYLYDISAMTWPDLERAYVTALMEKFRWNITWAAKASGINRSTFASRMHRLDIHRGKIPPSAP